MRNYQIYPYFLRDGVVLHDTGVGTVPNKQNFASTAKRWPQHQLSHIMIYSHIMIWPSYHDITHISWCNSHIMISLTHVGASPRVLAPEEAISVMPVSPDRGRDSNQPAANITFSHPNNKFTAYLDSRFTFTIYNSFSPRMTWTLWYSWYHGDIAACLGHVYIVYVPLEVDFRFFPIFLCF